MTGGDDTPEETQSVQTRYPYTNDGAAGWIYLTTMLFIGLHGVGLLDLATVPLELVIGVWIPGFGIATAWLFGGGAVKAWQSMNGGAPGG